MNGIREPNPEVMEAYRRRRERISKIMGEYLLKGYKMLDTYCDTCGNILMETRSGQLYCVACREVDQPSSAANAQDSGNEPVLVAELPLDYDESDIDAVLRRAAGGAEAAQLPESQQHERGKQSSVGAASSSAKATPNPIAPAAAAVPSSQNTTQRTNAVCAGSRQQSLALASAAVESKMLWASERLRSESNVAECRQLVQLIGECGCALHALR